MRSLIQSTSSISSPQPSSSSPSSSSSSSSGSMAPRPPLDYYWLIRRNTPLLKALWRPIPRSALSSSSSSSSSSDDEFESLSRCIDYCDLRCTRSEAPAAPHSSSSSSSSDFDSSDSLLLSFFSSSWWSEVRQFCSFLFFCLRWFGSSMASTC